MVIVHYAHRLPTDHDLGALRRWLKERGAVWDAVPGVWVTSAEPVPPVPEPMDPVPVPTLAFLSAEEMRKLMLLVLVFSEQTRIFQPTLMAWGWEDKEDEDGDVEETEDVSPVMLGLPVPPEVPVPPY